MCFSFVRDPLSIHSALERLLRSSRRPLSSASRRLYPVTVEPTIFFSRHGHAAAAHELGKLDPPIFRLLFCKVLFFRNAGPTIVFLRFALAHSYRFLQSGPRYIGTPPSPSFSASDSVLPPRHARLESVLRREFTKNQGYTLSRFYTAGQANFGDRTICRGYLLKEVSASLDRYSKLPA